MIINCVSLLHCGIYTKLSFSPALDFHLRDSKEFMTWYIWSGTVPHVRDGDLESTTEVRAKNNWLLYCGTAQILCVSQYVIWVYKMPTVQSALLLCSGKLSFLLADSLGLQSTSWVHTAGTDPYRKCIRRLLQLSYLRARISFSQASSLLISIHFFSFSSFPLSSFLSPFFLVPLFCYMWWQTSFSFLHFYPA